MSPISHATSGPQWARWRHPQNRKYITYCSVVRGGLSGPTENARPGMTDKVVKNNEVWKMTDLVKFSVTLSSLLPETRHINPLLLLVGRITVLAYVRRCGLLLPTEQRGLSVSRSVCRSVILVSPSKTAGPIEMPFGLRTRVDPGNHVLDGSPNPAMGRGNFEGKGRADRLVIPRGSK